jgi:hypothetical protein
VGGCYQAEERHDRVRHLRMKNMWLKTKYIMIT